MDIKKDHVLKEGDVKVGSALNGSGSGRSRAFIEGLLSSMETTPDAVVTADAEGRVVFCNSAVQKIFGYSQEEFMGMPVTFMLPERYRRLHFAAAKSPWKKDNFKLIGKTIELTGLRKDGSEFPIEFSISGWQSGGNHFFTYIIRDITERKLTEDKLRRMHAFSSVILNSMSDAIAIIDAGDFKIVGANRVFLSGLAAASEDEVKGKPCFKVIHGFDSPCEGPGHPCPLRETAATGKHQTVEHIIRGQNGEKTCIEVSTSPIKDEKGKIVEVVYVSRDITARKMEEEKLLRSIGALVDRHDELQKIFRLVESIKNEWEATIDCVGDMVILADRMGRIRRCNKTFKDFSGLPYEEILGTEWSAYLFDRVVEADECRTAGMEVFHDRTGRWYTVRSYPFTDGLTSEVRGEAISIHDSTELKLITEELEGKNAELSKAYAELKTFQAQLLQQEKMASIGQLAAGVAHEINNPVGFISSNLGTLNRYFSRITGFLAEQAQAIQYLDSTGEVLERLRDKKQELKLDYIYTDIHQLINESIEGAQRINKIVQDLKSFSRIDDSEMKAADINAGLESTVSIVWNEIKYKAGLKKEYGEIPLTKCNIGQLNQVFMNLLVNAVHSIDKQGEITIKTRYENGGILVSVSDTGCGITPEMREKIFEPFFTTKEAGKGTGLGLSIAYEIVKKHNGDITVESEPGKGTTFTVRVPVVE